MDNRGAALIMALWISAAAAAVAMAVLAMARDGAALSADAVQDTRALYVATAAALLAHSHNLSEPSWERTLGACRVRAVAHVDAAGRSAVLTCDVQSGSTRRVYDIGWTRSGGDWMPAWWRER